MKNFETKIVGTKNWIVTLNWDCLLENHLNSFAKVEPSSRSYLKIHGSYNWFYKQQAITAGIDVSTKQVVPQSDNEPVIALDRKEFDLLKKYYVSQNKLHEITPYIVYPSIHKRYGELFQNKLLNAFTVFMDGVQKIFIIGYSLPRHDHYIKAVLQRAMKSQQSLNIIIINSNIHESGLAGRVAELIGSGKRQEFFEVKLKQFFPIT